jgi:hypothetical protein
VNIEENENSILFHFVLPGENVKLGEIQVQTLIGG